jgi:hypothetical protein
LAGIDLRALGADLAGPTAAAVVAGGATLLLRSAVSLGGDSAVLPLLVFGAAFAGLYGIVLRLTQPTLLDDLRQLRGHL